MRSTGVRNPTCSTDALPPKDNRGMMVNSGRNFVLPRGIQHLALTTLWNILNFFFRKLSVFRYLAISLNASTLACAQKTTILGASPCLPAVGPALIFHGFLGPDLWLVFSRVLGSRSLAVFFTGSWVPIPGCFTFFTALSARVSSNSCQLLIQNHGCRSMDGSSSILTLVTSQAPREHASLS